jgi:poly-gamma-glutamate capsule biosynthesis protein CapA/YwtB (metallophosphatase superfamily)
MTEAVVLLGGGDVGSIHEPMERYSELVRRTLQDADYQKTVAQAAFAAGADLILGHHAHVPKAIEVFGGKTCFYSLSNFIMSSSPKVTGGAAEKNTSAQ